MSEAIQSRWWMRPALIMAAALLLRLLWSALVPVIPISDSGVYDAFAKSIAAGKGYAFPAGNLTAYWPVGAPAVYAALYAVFGTSGWVVAVFQALLGAIIVGLTWRLAHRFWGAPCAAIAAWLVTLWPLLIEFTTVLASELIFIALVLAAIDAWTARRLPMLWRAVVWGALIAGATFVRPTAWPLLLIFPVCSWLADRQGREAVVTLLVSVVTAALLFAPWVARNHQVFGSFVLVATNAGPNLWMGNNPESTGGYMALPDLAFDNEAERDRYFGHEAVAFIKSHPIDYLKLCVKRTITTYDRETIGVAWNEAGLLQSFGPRSLPVVKALSSAFWWAMLLLGMFGLWRVSHGSARWRAWPLLVTLGFLGMVPILTVAQDRYHMPIDPLLALFAAFGLNDLRRRPPGFAAEGAHA